jgi:hypothetical protein
MSISYSEKQAITERIQVRLDAAIKALEAQHIGEVTELTDTIRNQALEQLGLTAAVAELKENRKQQAELKERKDELETILSDGVKLPSHMQGYGWGDNFERYLKPYWQNNYDAALLKTEWGARIAKLQRERDNLVDTVLVATSPKQLKDLWARFNILLGIEPTDMERQVLAEPADPEA